MKNIQFKLTQDEEQLVKLVISNSKFRNFKDPKNVYMDNIIRALQAVSRP
jgi:hypothetical protein